MTFEQSIKYLEKLTIYGIKTGLAHTKLIARSLGNPQNFYPSILIGGTNGKGSTAAYIESILRESGFKTGLFTSPHLVDVRERIRINGKLISKDLFKESISDIKNAVIKLEQAGIIDESPTFFEVLTLAAFLSFKKEKIEFAVVEVGMGGKNDCTNILEPIVSAVTNVSFDHQQYLGKTLSEITREKSGIFRKNRIAVAGKTSERTNSFLKEKAEEIGAKFISFKDVEIKKNGEEFGVVFEGKKIVFPPPPLLGKHQIYNAALAVLICAKLMEMGFNISEEKIKKGIKKCRWDGRIQKIMEAPETFLDGAHNIDGIKKLSDFTKSLKGKKVLVFSALKDKPIKKMFKILEKDFSEVIFTKIEMKRGAEKEDFKKIWEGKKFLFVKEPFEALLKARKKAKENGIVIACGSLYLVGAILEKLKKNKATLKGTGL